MNAVLTDGGISGWYRRAGLLAWPAGRALVAGRTALGWRNALLRARVVSGPRIRTAATVCADGAAPDEAWAASDRRADAAAPGEDTGGAAVADGAGLADGGGLADGAGPACASPGMLGVPDTTV